MKQHDRHNDDELYQQIMAELRPGADEYDRLMAAGQNPGAMRATRRLIFRYAAAACALIVISTLALVLWQTERQQTAPQIAPQIAQAPPEGSPRGTDFKAPERLARRFPVGNLQEGLPKGPQKALQAPLEASGDEDAIQAEIMAQIEEEMARAMAEEELMRVMIEDELIQEVVATALRDIEQPQTIQFSL